MVRALQSRPDVAPRPRTARLAAPVTANGPRAHYMRASLAEGDPPVISPFPAQDSALLHILSQANALLIRPVGDGPREVGETVTYLPL